MVDPLTMRKIAEGMSNVSPQTGGARIRRLVVDVEVDVVKGKGTSGGGKDLKKGAYSSNVNSSGDGLGSLSNKEISVSEKGLNIVKEHIGKFDDYAPNNAMINRIENALANGEKLTGADASFYMHEVAESTMMKELTKTMSFKEAYNIAHVAAKNTTYLLFVTKIYFLNYFFCNLCIL